MPETPFRLPDGGPQGEWACLTFDVQLGRLCKQDEAPSSPPPLAHGHPLRRFCEAQTRDGVRSLQTRSVWLHGHAPVAEATRFWQHGTERTAVLKT